MSKKRKSKKSKSAKIKVISGAIVASVLLLISYGKQLGLPISDWEDIGSSAGIYEEYDVGILDELDGEFSVHYLDVGKADAIYINCGDFDMLIDSGEDTNSKQVDKYIEKFGAEDLDLVIATHPDKDHIGGMANIINSFEIGLFLEPEMEEKPTTLVYERMQNELDEKNVKTENPITGDNYEYGDINIDVLSPCKIYSGDNESSIVVKVTYKNTKFLFTGDATKKSEKDMLKNKLDLSADVLKVGHHGSKTSSHEEFLQAINPQIAVISVGPDKNNLPNDEVLDLLESLTIPFYRTDIYGNVIVTSNGKDISVKTQKAA